MAKKRKRRKGKRLRLIIPLALIMAFLFSLYDSSNNIEADEYAVAFDNLPAAFDGYRIAQLSDIHGRSFGDGNQTLLSILSSEDPDIIVITGDLIDSEHSPDTVRLLMSQLPQIAPVYYVTGNHEWNSPYLDELLEMLKDDGITVLQNEYVKLTSGSDSIVLSGLDDKSGYADMKTPEYLMNEIRENEGSAFTVLLVHRPNDFKNYASLGYDLIFSGHVHGGVIRLPFVGGLIAPDRSLFPPYTKGLYYSENDSTILLVSAGMASASGFSRVFNRLHVPIAVLRCK